MLAGTAGRHHCRKKAHERGAVGDPTEAAPGHAGRRRLARRSRPRSPSSVRMRMQLRAGSRRTAARPAGAADDDVDRLLLAFEELVSNGLRHGGGPVERGRDRRAGPAGCWRSATRRGTRRRSRPSTGTPPSAGSGCTWSRRSPPPTAGRPTARAARSCGPASTSPGGSPSPSRRRPRGPGAAPPAASPRPPGPARSADRPAASPGRPPSLVPDRTAPAQRRRHRRRPGDHAGPGVAGVGVNASNNERLLAPAGRAGRRRC